MKDRISPVGRGSNGETHSCHNGRPMDVKIHIVIFTEGMGVLLHAYFVGTYIVLSRWRLQSCTTYLINVTTINVSRWRAAWKRRSKKSSKKQTLGYFRSAVAVDEDRRLHLDSELHGRSYSDGTAPSHSLALPILLTASAFQVRDGILRMLFFFY